MAEACKTFALSAVSAVALSLASVLVAVDDDGRGGAPPLQVNIVPLITSPRILSPVPAVAIFSNNSESNIEGRLRIGIDQLNCVLETGDLFLPPGMTKRRVFLPPGCDSYIVLDKAFVVPGGKSISLGTQPLPMGRANYAVSLNIMEITDSMIDRGRDKLLDALRLEKLAPLTEKPTTTSDRVTATTSVQVENVIPSPFFFMVCDIAVIGGDALELMSQEALNALAVWIKGGGSALLGPLSSSPSRKVLDFIGALAKADPAAEGFPAPTPDGKVGFPEDGDGAKRMLLRPALGQAAVLAPGPSPTGNDFKSIWWRRISAFLWKARAECADRVAEKGRWLDQKTIDSIKEAHETNDISVLLGKTDIDFTSLSTNVPSIPDETDISYFLPAKFVAVPKGPLFFILALFVLVIGPGEYFILGKLKRRKWTWITFPLTCLLFTYATLKYTRSKLKTPVHVGRLVALDVSAENEIVRCETIRIPLASGTHIEQWHMKNTVVNPATLDAGSIPRWNYGFGFSQSSPEAPPVEFRGTLFSNYDMAFQIQQWLPLMICSTSFQAEPDDIPHWKFPETPSKNNEELSAFSNDIKANLSPNVAVRYVMVFTKDGGVLRNIASTRYARYYRGEFALKGQITDRIEDNTVVDVSTRFSIFSILSALSPTALDLSGNALRGADATDPGETVAVVVLYDKAKRESKIYRRIYR